MSVTNQGTEPKEPARSNLPTPASGERFREFNVIPRQLLFHSVVWQLLLALPLLSFFVLLMLGWHQEPSPDAGEAKSFPQRLTVLHMWAALFFSAALFSCLGSLVSYAGRDHPSDESIQYGSLALSMHLVGSVFGIVFLLLFLGGFVAGTLFPDFTGVGFFRIYSAFHNVRDWAKLFVWAFIAGFSERLMPDLLQNVAKRIGPPSQS